MLSENTKQMIVALHGKFTGDQVAETFNIGRSVVFKIWQKAGVVKEYGKRIKVDRERLRYDYALPHMPNVRHVLFGGEAPRSARSLTAELLGDPLPGRSALDRRRAAQSEDGEACS